MLLTYLDVAVWFLYLNIQTRFSHLDVDIGPIIGHRIKFIVKGVNEDAASLSEETAERTRYILFIGCSSHWERDDVCLVQKGNANKKSIYYQRYKEA